MRLASILTAIIRAAVQAASFTWRWCTVSGRWVADVARAAASVPGALIGGLFGSAPLPPAPEPSSESADAVKNALDTLTERRRKIDMQDQILRHSDPLGETIHAYASASEDERLDMDLDALPEHVRVWLLTRTEADLKKLAAAGPVKCGLVAAGKRSGIVGIEPPDPDQPMAPEPVVRRLDADEFFARIARAKGIYERSPLH
jgi:nucleotide-binding universal stress UspA family protein